MKMNSKGFTLIELLVVIAIIGILSTIAMTSLNSARKKANDASFQSSASSVVSSMVICCSDSTASISTTIPGDVCDSGTAGAWPADVFGTITVNTDCTDGLFDVDIANANSNSNIASANCTEGGCTF
ncbi:MAG: type II secretion system protein [Candidatus Pacebacteria bacterium]|nr:type II secretion system protein [Candidatus Paceibacterota bacterium]